VFYRSVGRGPAGHRPRMPRRYVRTRKVNLLSCIGWNGVQSFKLIYENTKTVDFNSYILDYVVPNTPIGSAIILDNASFHKSYVLQALVELQGRYLIFLSPYSPDLNPIEISYSFVKKKLQNWGSKNTNIDILLQINSAVKMIEEKHTQAWFHRCGYIY